MEMHIRRKSSQVQANQTPHQPCLYSDPFRNNHKRGGGSFQNIHNRFFYVYIYIERIRFISVSDTLLRVLLEDALFTDIYTCLNFENLNVSSNPEHFSVVYQKKYTVKGVEKSDEMHDLIDKSDS